MKRINKTKLDRLCKKYMIYFGNAKSISEKNKVGTIGILIFADSDDVEASVLMGITNNQRENTTDLEWGWAYRNTYETIARQGARTDLTSSQRETKLRSDEKVARFKKWEYT